MAISAPRVEDFEGQRLAKFEFDVQYHFRRKNTGEAIDIRGWGLQLLATAPGGTANFNPQLTTTIEGAGFNILRCLSETPRTAGLTDGADDATRTFMLWLSRAGTVGRKLLAKTKMVINPVPDGDVYKTGPLDAENFILEVDEGTGEYLGQIADPTAIYDELFNMVAGNMPTGQAATLQILAGMAAPSRSTFFEILGPVDVGGVTHPAGYYIRKSNGNFERFTTTPINQSALS